MEDYFDRNPELEMELEAKGKLEALAAVLKPGSVVVDHSTVSVDTAKRAQAIYNEDAAYGRAGKARKSHENPAIARIYEEFLTDGPCGHLSHSLLHTGYTPRGKYIG